MKRIFILMMLSLLATASVAAQQNTVSVFVTTAKAGVQGDGTKTRAEVLEQLADTYKFTRVILGTADLSGKFNGMLTGGSSVKAQIEELLMDTNAVAQYANDVVVILGKRDTLETRTLASTANSGSEARTPPAPRTTQADILQRQAVVQGQKPWCGLNRDTTPEVFDPAFGLTRGDWLLARNRLPCAPVYPIAPPPSYGRGGSYGYRSGPYDWNGGIDYAFVAATSIRDFSNLDKYGLLKIDGPDDFLQKVRVVVDGIDRTVASKANNAWNKAVLLTAGSHTIEFVRETKGKNLAFKRIVDIVPASVQVTFYGKPEPAWIRVSGNEFENADGLYEWKPRKFVEGK